MEWAVCEGDVGSALRTGLGICSSCRLFSVLGVEFVSPTEMC